jgi:signal transduction histidine kinase
MEGAIAVREPAERPAWGDLPEASAQLVWLAPDVASLAALARPLSARTWPAIRHDPGAVLLVVRHDTGMPLASFAALGHPALLATARTYLEQSATGFVDWNIHPARCIYRGALATARAARRLSEQCGLGDPERAWVCGLLAPLGSMAACAVVPSSGSVGDTGATTDLTRQLARRWNLPDWLTGVLGNLTLPLPLAESLGAEPLYYRFTHLALERARRQGFDLGLACPEKAIEAARALGVSTNEEATSVEEMPSTWRDPTREPLLLDLLTVAVENRRLQAGELHRRLERDVAALHGALREQVEGEAERLRRSKLLALAEFAAGAGHEINNPLAVISGQAQYLLSHGEEWFAEEPDDTSRKALQSILAQTRRIHGVLRDLMQYARPAAPRPLTIDLVALVTEVASGLQELAKARQIRLDVTARDRPIRVHVDPEQVRLALTCLVRNAVEAAPATGWARLRLAEPKDGKVEAIVEDSGPGPDVEQYPHVFDPFYSGRTAGRGRGLGLPIAWRLACLQGGAVRLEPPRAGQPMQAVLVLPCLADAESRAA